MKAEDFEGRFSGEEVVVGWRVNMTPPPPIIFQE